MTWKTALCGLTALFLFVRCETQTAGTSVGTGNPTEIEVAFRNDSGSEPITGTMTVYASTQIPVPGFSPAPLISVPVAGMSHAVLKASAFAALADTLWPKGSVENGLYRFNVVVMGETKGAVLKGFSFRKTEKDFLLRAEDANAVRQENTATLKGTLSPLVELKCGIDTATISPYKNHFLFMYGTGLVAKGTAGEFVFPSVPKGSYESFLLSIPMKGNASTTIGDSLAIYSLSAALTSGTNNPLAVGDVQIRVPTPQSLKEN
ncbi:MAG TPA: hypothetical protein VJ385_02450 [Fibrobacteria bacterium]|nr:hypothetical protein [Fibrobacteria bacterium]